MREIDQTRYVTKGQCLFVYIRPLLQAYSKYFLGFQLLEHGNRSYFWTIFLGGKIQLLKGATKKYCFTEDNYINLKGPIPTDGKQDTSRCTPVPPLSTLWGFGRGFVIYRVVRSGGYFDGKCVCSFSTGFVRWFRHLRRPSLLRSRVCLTIVSSMQDQNKSSNCSKLHLNKHREKCMPSNTLLL